MLQLKNVKKDYVAGDAVVSALKGVSLEFRANEFVSVLGQSGCGKTTLLNIIGGLDRYTSGDLIIRGKSTKDYTDRDWDVYRNHRIGFVFQSYNLIPHQTVLGNVELALTIAGCSKAERRRRARAALERVGLGKELHKKPNQLSGGQMQRVAIARALVNNPEILLADEPTGALDSETSVQIMDLIREIAGERLVIMVTHNPELAEKYSSRIIRLKDGVVVSDSAPYDSSKERETLVRKLEKNGWTAESALAWKKEKEKKERKRAEKASMSFFTALGLSARNLRAKKGRTIVTSVAGSIGIISVCLVLALSNGFNRYIVKTEEDMLSYYPLRVTETSIDIDSVMSNMTSRADMPDLSELDNKVYVNSFLTKLAKGMTVTNKISAEYLSYIEAMDESYYYAIQYGYGLDLSSNLFTNVNTGDTKENMQTQTMSLSSLKEYYTRELETNAGEQYGQMAYLVDYLGSVCGVMPGTDDVSSARYGEYVKSQYDVFGSFPSSSDEAVLVIGGNNEANDLLLAQLGFIDEPDFLSLFSKDAGADEYMTIDFDSVLEKRFTLFYNDAVYTRNKGSFNVYPFSYNGTRESLTASNEEGVNIKISGILRLKDGLSYGCLSSGLNLTEQLIDEYVSKNKASQIVTLMESDLTSSEVNYGGMKLTVYRSPSANLNEYYTRNEEASNYFGTDIYIAVNQKNAIRALGGCSDPNSVSFYPKDFASKDKMLSYLDEWNASHEDDEKITYTDTVGLMMGMMQTMLSAITYVLVAFTAISLIVSSVMIGIITYVSVVERTKEIGVLRSLGSRKRDVRNLFNAETFIIGLSSGVFGAGVTYALSVAINVVMKSLTGIANLAALPLTSALVMVCVSVVLTLISGLIPARAAAKKDPVIALRTE